MCNFKRLINISENNWITYWGLGGSGGFGGGLASLVVLIQHGLIYLHRSRNRSTLYNIVDYLLQLLSIYIFLTFK